MQILLKWFRIKRVSLKRIFRQRFVNLAFRKGSSRRVGVSTATSGMGEVASFRFEVFESQVMHLEHV